MLNRSTLQLSELKNETRVLRATLIMLERVARSDFERLRHYLTGLDSRLQALETMVGPPVADGLSAEETPPPLGESRPPHRSQEQP